MPGRGGQQHKYLQSLIRKLGEDRGFTASTEKRVLDGHGHVDVYLERDGLTIGCEISVTTGAEHETQNIAKCLSAGFGYAVLVSANEETLAEAKTLLGPVDEHRVRFLTPDGLISFMEEFGEHKEPTSPKAKKGRDTGEPEGRQMLMTDDAAPYIGVAVQTLAKMRLTGDSPPYYKMGRRVLYDRAELDAWIDARKRRSTSDSGNQP